MNTVTLRKGMMVGLTGGLAATIAIDAIVIAIFPLMGLTPDVSFSVIGNTAGGFFSMLGLPLAGGVPAGLVVHYITGMVLGAIWGAAVMWRDALRSGSLVKNVGWGILYTEVISFPLLVTAPIILHMAALDAAQWFGISFVMHGVYGSVLAAATWYGMRKGQPQAAVSGVGPLPPNS